MLIHNLFREVSLLPCVMVHTLVFTTLLLGHSHSGAPFRDVFSISVALSLSVVLQLSHITPGESEAKVVGRNTRPNRDNKNTIKNILSAVIGLFDLPKLLNLVTKLLFILHGFSTMTSSIKILLLDLPGFNPGFKIVLKLLKLPPEVVFRFSR